MLTHAVVLTLSSLYRTNASRPHPYDTRYAVPALYKGWQRQTVVDKIASCPEFADFYAVSLYAWQEQYNNKSITNGAKRRYQSDISSFATTIMDTVMAPRVDVTRSLEVSGRLRQTLHPWRRTPTWLVPQTPVDHVITLTGVPTPCYNAIVARCLCNKLGACDTPSVAMSVAQVGSLYLGNFWTVKLYKDQKGTDPPKDKLINYTFNGESNRSLLLGKEHGEPIGIIKVYQKDAQNIIKAIASHHDHSAHSLLEPCLAVHILAVVPATPSALHDVMRSSDAVRSITSCSLHQLDWMTAHFCVSNWLVLRSLGSPGTLSRVSLHMSLLLTTAC